MFGYRFLINTFISLIFFFSSSSFAKETKLAYKDKSAREWQRWIIEEDHGKSGTLLLVIDGQKGLGQQTLLKKFFTSRSELLAAKKTYESLALRKPNLLPMDGTHSPLWVATREWSLDDEKDYANWVNTQVTTKSYEYQGVLFDCADFSILTRWIYAHDHLLPAANSLAGSGDLMGQWSGRSDWDKLSTDADWRNDNRFKAAMRFLLDSTYTHTIFQDLYPVQLTSDFVTPGSIILVLYSEETGHTQVIKNIGQDDDNCGAASCITTIWGNEPSRDIAFEQAAWIVNGGQSYGGFLRWRWPHLQNTKWVLTSPETMPGYSLEQYQYPQMSNEDYTSLVYNKIGISSDVFGRANGLLSLVKSMLQNRIGIVDAGFTNCGLVTCDPNGSTYDAYSTPGQDSRFRKQAYGFSNLYNKLDFADSRMADIDAQLDDTLFVSAVSGSGLTYRDYIFNDNELDLSTDPRDAISARWGYTEHDVNESLNIEISSWIDLWKTREQLVERAQQVCFSQNQTAANCDDNAIKGLDTSMIDNALRDVQSHLVALATQISGEDLDQMNRVTGAIMTAETFCANSKCSINDFVFANSNYLAKMSSNPRAIYRDRFGY